MDDPVADILHQRAAMDSSAAAAVIASLLAHAGLSALAIAAAWHHTAVQAPEVMTIRFAKVPAAVAPVEESRPRRSTPPAAPAPAPVAPPKKIVKPVVASPFGKSNKKETAAPAPAPAPAAPPGATSTAPQIAIGSAGVTGLEGGEFPYTVYIDRMKTLIGTRWLRPAVANGATATVYFVIDRDGTLRDVKLETSSGSTAFDLGAQRAVLESSPLPPLPFGYSGTYLGVHLTFR